MGPETEYKSQGLQTAKKYLEIFTSFVYGGLGIAILLGSLTISSGYSIPLGCTLIAYCIFRGFRVYQKYF